MKGIVVHNLGRKTEGIDLVQKGSKLDAGSHIVWHVSALVWRAERDLPQALQCYLKAIKCDKVWLSTA
jgi:hypothetical protein